MTSSIPAVSSSVPVSKLILSILPNGSLKLSTEVLALSIADATATKAKSRLVRTIPYSFDSPINTGSANTMAGGRASNALANDSAGVVRFSNSARKSRSTGIISPVWISHPSNLDIKSSRNSILPSFVLANSSASSFRFSTWRLSAAASFSCFAISSSLSLFSFSKATASFSACSFALDICIPY